jgi:hypothetical protein
MTLLTPEQRQAVREAGATPVHLTDPDTNETYVLVKQEAFDRLAGLLDDGLDMRQVGAMIDQAMREEDAGDPLLESYQVYRA